MRINRTLVLPALLAAVFGVACSQQRAGTPDVAGIVKDALKAHNLTDVKVSEDREKGVVTISGDVRSGQEKADAEALARQNANGLIVANEIGVRPEGAESAAKEVDKNLDKGIEDNYRAALIANGMDNQHIHFTSTNGVITLKGDVDTPSQRGAAERMAAKIPNVAQVVNEIQVKGAGRSSYRPAASGE